jgi:tyrosine-protein kinase Etk/Wzc
MQNETPTPNGYIQEEEVHLSDYLNVLYRRRRIAVAGFLAVVIGVTLYTFLARPVYEATATLHVRDEKVRGGNLLGDLGLSRDNPIETEIEIVKSRTNIEEVVRRLHLNWVVDDRSDGLSFRLADFASAAEDPEYRLELTDGASYRVLDGDARVVAEGGSGVLARGDGFSLLLDDLQGKPGDAFRLTLTSFNATVNTLREAVRASEVGKGTNIIRLSYQSHDPVMASDVVNGLAQAYLERSIVLKTQEASRSVEFIAQQLEQVRTTLDGAERDLENFKSASGVVRLDAEAATLVERLASSEKEQTAVRLRQRQAEFAADALKQALERRESYAPAILLDEPVVAALAQKLTALEVEKQGLLVELAPGHPAVQAVQERIAEVQRKLFGNYRSILAGLRDTDRTLGDNLERYESELKKLPAAELELARLSRLATVNAEIYTFLLQKHEEARIAKASTISNINIIDPAIAPEKPVKPQKKKNLLLGLIVGAMLGVGLAFFREYLDDSIKDEEGAKRLLGLPVLTLIPFIGRRANSRPKKGEALPPERTLIADLDPRSSAAESFRSLRTALHFAGNGRPNQVLLVTSTLPGEGKTTVSANLAVTLAQTGSRVLLIGCDLRKPTLHQMFHGDNTNGLTDYLVGDADLEKAVRATGLYNLDFISAGTVPPNPAELLGSERMRKMLEELRGRYDTILLDAPPTLAVTDAAVLTTFADATVMVVEIGGVGAKAAQRAMEVLRSTRTPLAGLILNDKRNRGVEYYGYYGRYGKYAFGYGEA